MLRNPRRTRPGVSGRAGSGCFSPWPAEAGGRGAGEQELGVRGHEEPDPAVCLAGVADFRGGEAEGALEELEGVLDVEACEVGAPELVQGQGAGAGMPQPHGAVRVASVGQALDGDVDESAAQDRQFLPSGEPAAVAVDEGVDAVPGLGADGAVESGVSGRVSSSSGSGSGAGASSGPAARSRCPR
jgi:hypothetical protein